MSEAPMLLQIQHSAFTVVAAIVVLLASIETSFAQGPDDPASLSYISTDSSATEAISPVELWRAGLYAGLNRNVYSADNIRGLPEVPSCCPDYSSGGGFGITLGGTAGLPLSASWGIHWRGAYNSYSGSLRTEELETVDANHERVLATFEHTIEAQIQALTLESFASFQVYPSIFISAGVKGDLVIKKWFHQKEFLASPEGITFENGKRTRLDFEGDIPQANSLLAGITANIRYELPLNKSGNIVLAPEVAGWYGLSNVVEDLPWGIHGIRFGISLQYIHFRQPEKPKKGIEPIRTGPTVPSATDVK